MNQRKANSATVFKTLVYYDGPQLVLLRSDYNDILLGMAIEKDGYRYPIICCQMLPRYLNRYLAGKADLRFVFKRTPASRIYFADLGYKADRLRLVRATEADLEDDDVFPAPGLFSRVHTASIGSSYEDDAYKRRFEIDGTWEARDFSRFHGRMADAYSLLFIARKLDANTPSAAEVDFLKSSISEKPWEGGGSYLSFYADMKEDGVPMHALRVAGIEYHSPGFVDLAGEETVMNEVISSITNVMKNHSELVTVYRAIRRVMSRDGILKAGKEANFSSVSLETYVEQQTKRFAILLSLPNPDQILGACDGNIPVFAKVVLSYYRRLRSISDFFVEGRVALAEQPVSLRDG